MLLISYPMYLTNIRRSNGILFLQVNILDMDSVTIPVKKNITVQSSVTILWRFL